MLRVLAAVALCLALTLAIDLKPYPDSAKLYFSQFDVDNDGEVPKAEFLAGFPVYDVDNNGIIDLAEFKVHIAKDHPQFVGYEDKMIKYNDYNQDGQVKLNDFEEFFTAYDKNGDGILSLDEWLEQFVPLLAVLEADLNSPAPDKEL